MPQITPSRIIRFDDSGGMGDYCVSNFFFDEAGRMYLSTCGVMASSFSVNLLQYDGYSLWPYELGRKKLKRVGGVQIAGYDEEMGFYGFLNHGPLVSNLFRFQPNLDSLILFPDAEEYIGGILSVAPGELMIAKRLPDSLALYNWTSSGFELISQFFFPFAKDDEGNILRLNNAMSFQKEGRYIYYRDQCLTTLRYDLESHKLQYWGVPAFPDQGEELDCSGYQIVKINRLEVVDSIIFCRSSTLLPQFYKLKPGSQHFEPLPFSLKGGVDDGIFKDETGNLLFLYQTQEGKMEAILQDSLGQYWNYSPMVESFANITKIVGKDFKRQAFIATRSGAYKVLGKHQKAITSYLAGRSWRWVAEVAPGQYLIKQDGIRSMFHLNTQLDSTRVATPYPFFKWTQKIPRKMLTSPDGQVYLLVDSNDISGIHVYDPSNPEDISNFQPLGVRSTWHATILEDGRIAFLNVYTKQLNWYFSEQNRVEPALVRGKPLYFSQADNHFLLPSRDGNLWVASNNGVYKVSPQEEQMQYFDLESGRYDYRVVVLHEDQQGRLVAGTVKNGVQTIDPQTGEVLQVVNEEKGLSNNTVVSILEDDEGDFWVGTFNGLNIVSPEGNVKYKLYVEDGLPSNEFNRLCFTKASNGHLLFGTLEGLIEIDPIALKKDLYKREETHIYISELSYYVKERQEEVLFRNYNPSDKTITLPARQRYLRVKVALSNYGFSEQSNFVYKLEGIDPDWNYLGKQHTISLSSLPAGRYNLVINGIDEQGNWTKDPIILKLHTKDFFYRQSWFLLLCFGVIGAISYAWIVYLRREKKRLEKEVESRTRKIVQQANELQQMDEIKSRFFTNISHELRTPVTLIATPIEHILRKHAPGLSRELNKSLQIIRNNAKRLRNLVEELLELSRLEAGKAELAQSVTHLHSFCRQLFSAYESGAHLKQINYQFQFELEESLHVLADKKRLEKIINNLLSNALKFTPNGGKVTFSINALEVLKTSRALILKVEDTGRGIPPEDLPHIFDRYFQTKRTPLPLEGGTGIGLALSKELAELMQGSLSVESKLEKGSTFILRFPLQVIAPPEIKGSSTVVETISELAQEENLPLQQSTNDQQETILIVEDNPDMQQLLVDLLSEQYHCLLADNGAEAWSMLKNEEEAIQKIQIILSDIMMPQMDGYALLDKIKSHKRWQQLPVIMLTARATEKDKLQALRMGVDDYLIKPFSSDELQTRVQNLICNYQRRQQFIAKNASTLDLEFKTEPSSDRIWLNKLGETIQEAIENKLEVNTLYLADQMASSERNLRRRLKALTGLSTKQYVQEVKLQKARNLLENKTYNTISEIAYACGFNTPGYFSQVYEKHFGKRPANYLSTSD